ncbi:MAG TPA: DUF4434 domain-containing protein [Deltaproteobacteria bacterium]|nr:DUF4434 domain-containing protein [Deltaproteobacteria bacterium]HQB38011.1 DUF4434 domain-containing protein [Deltaproteobacteria bacterium]
MPTRYLFLLIFHLSILLALPEQASALPQISGTFIQLQEQHNRWDNKQWDILFDQLQSLGIRQIIVQWSVNDNMAFYRSKVFKSAVSPPVEHILATASQRGMDVYVGLAADPLFWENIKYDYNIEEYLKRLRLKSELAARELAAVTGRCKAFKGWYIAEEIDDLSWQPQARRKLLFQHLGLLSGFLKQQNPGKSVMISGFSNARMSPGTYEQFWGDLLKETSVTTVLFQDGAGTGKLSAAEAGLYMQALQNAAVMHNRSFMVIIELFQQLTEAPFKAVPANMTRVEQQLKAAAPYADAGVFSFSIPDYMLQVDGNKRRPLFESYKAYMKQK